MSFQVEKAALIREIARNLVGLQLPPPAANSGSSIPDVSTPLQQQGNAAQIAAKPVLSAGLSAAAAASTAMEGPLLADQNGGAVEASPALTLLGLKLPQTLPLTPQTTGSLAALLAQAELIDGESAGVVPEDIKGVSAPTFTAQSVPDAGGGFVSFVDEVAPQDAGAARPEGASSETNPLPYRPDSASSSAARIAGQNSAFATATTDYAATPAALMRELPDATTATQSVVEQVLTSLGIAEGQAAQAALRTELGGIISNFILNAHFQPGWPPLRPIQDPEAKAVVAQLAKDPKLSKDEIAMLTYLANFGVNRGQIVRLVKLVMAAKDRSRLLQSIGLLLANLGAILGAVQEEIDDILEEIKEARAEGARRERLTLR